MKGDITICLENHKLYEQGIRRERWIVLPYTEEEITAALNDLDILDKNREDLFVNGYAAGEGRFLDIPFDWVHTSDLSEFNRLALNLENLSDNERDKLDAILEEINNEKDFAGKSFKEISGIKQFNAFIENDLNSISYIPGILNYKDLGDHYLYDSDKVSMPDNWKSGIDKEEFGRNAASYENGTFNSYGYLAQNTEEEKVHEQHHQKDNKEKPKGEKILLKIPKVTKEERNEIEDALFKAGARYEKKTIPAEKSVTGADFTYKQWYIIKNENTDMTPFLPYVKEETTKEKKPLVMSQLEKNKKKIEKETNGNGIPKEKEQQRQER